jgi:hypothetical protein
VVEATKASRIRRTRGEIGLFFLFALAGRAGAAAFFFAVPAGLWGVALGAVFSLVG